METALNEKPKEENKVILKPVSKSKPTILPAAWGLAEYKRNDWVADIDPTLEVDDILDAGYWAHIASEINPLDTIEARWEDGSKIVHLRVLFSERTYAKVRLISVEELGEISTEAPSSSLKHSIQWKGPRLRFAVIRNSDNVIVQSGFRERGQASSWLTEHERT